MQMNCLGTDLECLEKKRKLREEAGAGGGADLVPYIGGAAVIVGVAVARAPEKTADPAGMKKREEFYEKRKADTEAYKAEQAGESAVATAEPEPEGEPSKCFFDVLSSMCFRV